MRSYRAALVAAPLALAALGGLTSQAHAAACACGGYPIANAAAVANTSELANTLAARAVAGRAQGPEAAAPTGVETRGLTFDGVALDGVEIRPAGR